MALSKKISSVEAVKLVRNGTVPKPNKHPSTKSNKIIKQSSIDSVKTKSKSSESTTLKDNNKIVQKVKDAKEKNQEKQSKERKEKETKINRDVKKVTKEVKSSEKVKSEKVKARNDAEVKKSTTKITKEEPEVKVLEEVDAKINDIVEADQAGLANKDVMGEVIVKSNDDNDLQKSFEPEIVSIEMQSGLNKSHNEEIVDHVTNGDVPRKEKSARRSGKKEALIISTDKINIDIDAINKNEPDTTPPVTSNGENSIEQEIEKERKHTEEPKSSRKMSMKKENKDPNDSTRTGSKTIGSKSNSVDIADIPSIPRPRTSLRPPSVRPASARPGAPRRRDRNVEIILQPDGNMPKPGVNIKIDNMNIELEDDGENLVIIEDSSTQSNDNKFGIDVLNENDEEQQGHLVQQILETQKEFLKIDEEANDIKRRTETVS